MVTKLYFLSTRLDPLVVSTRKAENDKPPCIVIGLSNQVFNDGLPESESKSSISGLPKIALPSVDAIGWRAFVEHIFG